MENKLVSCIVPTYKRSSSLHRAIKSILNQTYDYLEVIIVDDNEPNDDYSLNVQGLIAEINDPRIKYLQQEKHYNGASARNYGIKHSTGEYIAFLDDDDEWLPEKIELQVAGLMSLNDSYGGITCLSNIYKNNVLISKDPSYLGGNLHRQVIDRSISIHTCTVLFRRTALDISGYFDVKLPRHQEIQLFLDFFTHFQMEVIQKYLINIHTDDGINRLKSTDLIQLKKNFFILMNKHMIIYNKKDQRIIRNMHYFEIILVLIREGKLLKIIAYLFKIGLSIKSYLLITRRIRLKIKSKRRIAYLNDKNK